MRLLALVLSAVGALHGGQLLSQEADSSTVEFSFPKIKTHGRVVRLPNAAHQPRGGSRIVVDVTGGGAADTLHPAIDKLNRFVNIYAGAGSQPADVEIVAVLHDAATLVGLSDAAYERQFGVAKNPNLEVLRRLRKNGVTVFVCGQSLVSKGAQPREVDSSVTVAVSALTSLVNLQADGYAYIPLSGSVGK
jgi:intracellular sulfur oxidation DsrE/DsrF family protein